MKVTFLFYVPVGRENGTHEISAQFGVETRLAVAPFCASDTHSTVPVPVVRTNKILLNQFEEKHIIKVNVLDADVE